MADAPMVVEVVTPEHSLVSGSATAIVLRSSDGELTILPGHTPLITDVVPGLVKVEREEGTELLAVHGGAMHVDTGPGAARDRSEVEAAAADGATLPTSTRVAVLAGIAEVAGEIDVDRAERARAEAEERVRELTAAGARGRSDILPEGEERTEADQERAECELALARAELRLELARGGN